MVVVVAPTFRDPARLSGYAAQVCNYGCPLALALPRADPNMSERLHETGHMARPRKQKFARVSPVNMTELNSQRLVQRKPPFRPGEPRMPGTTDTKLTQVTWSESSDA